MTPSILQRLFILIASAMLLASCGNVKFSGFSTEKVGEEGIHDDNGGPTPDPSPGGGSPTPSPALRTVTYSEVVPANPNKVDILLVIDDSGSMKTDQLKLASKLSGFANLLESQNVPMDWQMCVTVTRSQLISNNYYWGASVNWVGYSPAAGTPQYVLKKGTANLNSIFTQTINAIGAGVPGSGDERGIKAAFHHFYNGEPGVSGTSGCYRSDAAVSVIVISDEDERSVGGDCSRIKTNMNEDPKTCLPLEAADLPNNLLSQAKTVFGTNVRFTFNSIVVADSVCEKTQDETPDELSQRSPSHQGLKYIETSRLTNGGIGSICDSDFSTNLNIFKDKILNSVSSLTLECAPVSGTLAVAIDGANTTAYTLTGANLKFTSAVVEGRRVTMTYKCTP